jgi:2-amino-4-hydroxy-6-hydroxymethyldihydropteridine diphosphokinase
LDPQRVFLSLGSNLGDRLSRLAAAVDLLRGTLEDLRVSSIFETEPLYLLEQPKFYNIVVSGTTRLPPRDLLHRVLAIEAGLGRNRTGAVPKGPRPIDIDILLYGARVVEEMDLRIPHPGLPERRFVLAPLAELAPDLRDPVTGQAYAKLLADLPGQGVAIVGPWEYTLCLPEHDREPPGRKAEL